MRWHILSVDDDPDVGRQIKQLLDGRVGNNGDELIVDTLQNFDDALQKLDTMLYDIIILDVFKGQPVAGNPERPGEDILLEIKKRCFIPVVFYTALPNRVTQYQSGLVRVIHKTSGGAARLKAEILTLIRIGLPEINRNLIEHFCKVEAKYMWEFVEPAWNKFSKDVDPKSLAYLLSRRLAWSLARENIHSLISSFGGSTGTGTDEDVVHPVEYYIFPPIGNQYNTGDILLKKKKKKITYSIILTPSCDMFKREGKPVKSEYVLVAGCFPLSVTAEVKKWKEDGSETSKKSLEAFMKNNKQGGQKERYHFLPGTFFLPNMFVDFQALDTVPFGDLEKFERVATLDSPFAECVLNGFCRYIGRIGTPDLNPSEINAIIENLKKRKKKK